MITVYQYLNTESIHSYFARLPEEKKKSMYTLASIINFVARYEKLYGYIFMKNTGYVRSSLPH